MSAPGWILLGACLASFAIVVAMGIGLVREGIRLARTGMRFAADTMPIIDEIAAGAYHASAKAAALAERAASLRPTRR